MAYKKAVLPQGNRAMPQRFFSVLTAMLFHFLQPALQNAKYQFMKML